MLNITKYFKHPLVGNYRLVCLLTAPCSFYCRDLVVGMKLYGQKFNDIWYKGTLTEIHNKEKPRIEVSGRFSVVFQ